jgi:hypothetical protein
MEVLAPAHSRQCFLDVKLLCTAAKNPVRNNRAGAAPTTALDRLVQGQRPDRHRRIVPE